MENLFQKIDTVFVTIKNQEKCIEWYRNCLGLDLVWQDDYVSVLSTGKGTPVTLLHKKSPDDEYPIFNFLTENIEKAHRHLEEQGVEVEPIRETDVLKTFDFKDPEGNRLNVCRLKKQ